MLQGCFTNPHQWLIEHTWIHWYIRDQHGNLRPVWNSDAEAPQTIHSRWRGYGTGEPESKFGRLSQPEFDGMQRDTFYRTLPEYPFRVSQTVPQSNHLQSDRVFLQFWTWSATFKLFPCDDSASEDLGQGLKRYDITDYTGDWCGTIVLDASWGSRIEDNPGEGHEFLAISDAKGFTEAENDTWTYYIPKEKDQADWDLYFVLLVQYHRGIASRVGLGKVFKQAFDNSCFPGREWKEIIMA